MTLFHRHPPTPGVEKRESASISNSTKSCGNAIFAISVVYIDSATSATCLHNLYVQKINNYIEKILLINYFYPIRVLQIRGRCGKRG